MLGRLAALFMALVYAFFKDDVLEAHNDLAIKIDSPAAPNGGAPTHNSKAATRNAPDPTIFLDPPKP